MKLTPSQKLDRILAEGYEPAIGAVVDLSKYKYVWRNHGGIRCGNYLIDMVYGLMSDGASIVPDRVAESYWAHDRLYLMPHVWYKGVQKTLSKRQCDYMYAKLGLKHRSYIVFFEGLFLSTGINRKVWDEYRAQDSADLIVSHTVPHALFWEFPSQFVEDAVWIG